MKRITSRTHPLIKRFRALAAKRSGDEVLLDGEHLIGEALDAGVPIDAIVADIKARDLAERAEAAGAEAFEAPTPVIEAASPVRSPAGVVAIARWAPLTVSAAFDVPAPLAIGLVDVQDPGNIGSAIRSGAALGATAVIAIGASADPGGWKVLRGAMGTTFRIAVARGSIADTVAEARRRKINIVATTAAGGSSIEDVDFTMPTLVLLGNEGTGLADATLAAAAHRVTIPMRAGVNSLNVAVTAALFLWEANRQRLARSHRR